MKQKLKIHFFVQFVYKQGTYFRFHNFAIGLQQAGHTVVVYGAKYGKGEKSSVEYIDGVKYDITACYFPLQRWFGQWQHPYAIIKRSLKKYPICDVSHSFQPFGAAFVPWYLNRNKAKLNVYDWDDLWTNGLLNKQKGFLNRLTYYQVRVIEQKGPLLSVFTSTCSNFLLNRANQLGTLNTQIFYNGFWPFTPNTKELARKKMHLKTDSLYLGFMGRTVNEIEWCFQLLLHALPIYPNLRLALCGMPKEIYELADDFIKNNTDYLGFLLPEETRDFATALDIGLLPLDNGLFNQSRFPIKFAEYLASGTPILCSEVGECATIAKRFNFVKLASPNADDWIQSGIEMLKEIQEKKWPVVDSILVEEILSWPCIIKNLEKMYIKSIPIN